MHVNRKIQPAALSSAVDSRATMPIETKQVFAVHTGFTRFLTHLRPTHFDLFWIEAGVFEATWTERALTSQKVAFAISFAGL
jgi:hypothetical protein